MDLYQIILKHWPFYVGHCRTFCVLLLRPVLPIERPELCSAHWWPQLLKASITSSQLQDLRHGIDDGIAVDIPDWASNLLLSSMELSIASQSDRGQFILTPWEPHSPILGLWKVKVGCMLSFGILIANFHLCWSLVWFFQFQHLSVAEWALQAACMLVVRFRWIYVDDTTGPGAGELCPLTLALNHFQRICGWSWGRDPFVIIYVFLCFSCDLHITFVTQ